MNNEEAEISRIKIRLIADELGEAEGEVVRHLAPRTVDSLVRILPVEGRAALWKEEIYFEIPMKMGKEKAKSTVEKGTIAFWPIGSAICVFYGETQPYSPVNILGKVTENLDMFSKVKSGTRMRMEKIQREPVTQANP